jgi:hypothetical protein
MRHRDCNRGRKGRSPMLNRGKIGKQIRYLSKGLLLILVVHFLSLCTLSPQVHAALLYQSARALHSPTGHCALPSSGHSGPLSPTPTSNTTPAQESNAHPACCAVVFMHKATTISPIQVHIPFFLSTLFLSARAPSPSEEMPPLPLMPTRDSASPPPLYLLHAVLLI